MEVVGGCGRHSTVDLPLPSKRSSFGGMHQLQGLIEASALAASPNENYSDKAGRQPKDCDKGQCFLARRPLRR